MSKLFQTETFRHPPAARAGLRAALLQLVLAAATVGVVPAAHADLWAFVDEFGITHFAAEALDERYKMYFKGNVYDSAEQGLKPRSSTQPEEIGLQARTRTQSFFDVSPHYKSVRPHLQKAAANTGVDYDLLKAVIAVESGFDAGAVSPKGAVGLMQLMPATAQRFGVSASAKKAVEQQLVDPAINIPAGARYLHYLMDLFPDRLDLVLAAYNAGEGAVKKAGKAIPPFKETRNYVKAVMGIYEQLQAGKPKLATRVAVARPGAKAGIESSPHARVRMTLPGQAAASN